MCIRDRDINGEKTDIYPISEDIRQKMQPFWKILKEKGLINEEKYKRLTRNYELTDEELSSFVARQLVETQQSTKALATLLKKEYPSAKIVYSKAGNVSEFRNRKDKELPKFREINDLHHAKDAYLNIVVGNVDVYKRQVIGIFSLVYFVIFRLTSRAYYRIVH